MVIVRSESGEIKLLEGFGFFFLLSFTGEKVNR